MSYRVPRVGSNCHLISNCDKIEFMIIVPLYAEIASDEQWRTVEKALRDLKVCFFTDDKIEGMELAEVESIIAGAKTLEV